MVAIKRAYHQGVAEQQDRIGPRVGSMSAGKVDSGTAAKGMRHRKSGLDTSTDVDFLAMIENHRFRYRRIIRVFCFQWFGNVSVG